MKNAWDDDLYAILEATAKLIEGAAKSVLEDGCTPYNIDLASENLLTAVQTFQMVALAQQFRDSANEQMKAEQARWN